MGKRTEGRASWGSQVREDYFHSAASLFLSMATYRDQQKQSDTCLTSVVLFYKLRCSWLVFERFCRGERLLCRFWARRDKTVRRRRSARWKRRVLLFESTTFPRRRRRKGNPNGCEGKEGKSKGGEKKKNISSAEKANLFHKIMGESPILSRDVNVCFCFCTDTAMETDTRRHQS